MPCSSAVASTDCQLIAVSSDAFLALMHSRPETAVSVLASTFLQLQGLVEHIEQLKTRFEKDYVRVWNEEELAEWVERGYSVRMSNPGVSSHRAASLISPDSITREVESHTAWPSHAAEVPSTRNFLLGVALLVCISLQLPYPA